jgi:hypothetical protein
MIERFQNKPSFFFCHSHENGNPDIFPACPAYARVLTRDLGQSASGGWIPAFAGMTALILMSQSLIRPTV